MPNHHFTAAWNSTGSIWRLSPTEGITESKAAACGDKAESSCAVLGKEALSSYSPDDGFQFYQTGISGTAQPLGDPILMHHQGRQVH